MKILFNGYLNFFPGRKKNHYGGPQVFTESFIKKLSKTPHTYVGFILHGNIKHKNTYSVTVKENGKNSWILFETYLAVKKFLKAKSSTLPPYAKTAISLITTELDKIRPDIVLLNGFSLTNWYLLKAAKKLKLPVIVTHQGLWFKEAQAIRGVNKNAIKIFKNMEKDITKLQAFEVFLNQYSQDVYSKNLIKPAKSNTAIVNLPFSLNYLNKKLPSYKSSGQIKIGMVGRWDPIKNPEAYLKIAQLAKRLNKPWKFYAITKLFKSRHLTDFKKSFSKYIKILPQTSPQNLKKFYQSMNLMILPSRFDVSPNVVMEALLQNRGTLISPNVGWVSEYKKYGAEKWIDDFLSPIKTIKKIEQLLKTPPPKQLINYVALHHNPQFVINEYFKLFKKLI